MPPTGFYPTPRSNTPQEATSRPAGRLVADGERGPRPPAALAGLYYFVVIHDGSMLLTFPVILSMPFALRALIRGWLGSAGLLFRSPGRPSHQPLVRYKSFRYQAKSWATPRRIAAKVEHHVGELFPRVGFIVTTLPLSNRAVVRFYNKRGTAEQ